MADAIFRSYAKVTIILFFIIIFLPLILTARSFGIELDPNVFLNAFAPLGSIVSQALVSTLLALAIGFPLALFIDTNNKITKMLLVPNFIPPLILAAGYLPLLIENGVYPSFWTVVVFYSVINAGLIAYTFANTLQNKLSGYSQTVSVLGGNKHHYLWLVLKAEIKFVLSISLVVFFFCSNNFYLATLLGGTNILSFDQLAYLIIKDNSLSGVLFWVLVLQFVLYFALSITLSQTSGVIGNKKEESNNVFLNHKLTSAIGLIFLFLSVLAVTSSLSDFSFSIAQQDKFIIGSLVSLFRAIVVSVLIYLGYNFLFAITLFAKSKTWLDHLVPLGFVGYLVFGAQLTHVLDSNVVTLLFVIYFLPLFWFWFGTANRHSAIDLVTQSQILGADAKKAFSKIIHPFVHKQACLVSGISASWVAGEFAFESYFRGDLVGIALIAQESLVLFKTAEVATANGMLIIICIFVFLVWERLSHVYK